MSTFNLNARIGYNDEDRWNVGVMITGIDTREEATALAQALAKQFQDFIRSRGGTISDVSSPIGSEVSPGLALPPGFIRKN